MSQFYIDPAREDESAALPDAEVFYITYTEPRGDSLDLEQGWYWWPCFPGCLPDGEPIGPFDSKEEAISNARDAV